MCPTARMYECSLSRHVCIAGACFVTRMTDMVTCVHASSRSSSNSQTRSRSCTCVAVHLFCCFGLWAVHACICVCTCPFLFGPFTRFGPLWPTLAHFGPLWPALATLPPPSPLFVTRCTDSELSSTAVVVMASEHRAKYLMRSLVSLLSADGGDPNRIVVSIDGTAESEPEDVCGLLGVQGAVVSNAPAL